MGSLSKALEHLPLPKDGYLFDEGIVANLLSLGKIAKEFRVVMDTDIDDAIYVYGKDGKYLRFGKTAKGLYCMELHDEEEKETCLFATIKRKNGDVLGARSKASKSCERTTRAVGIPIRHRPS